MANFILRPCGEVGRINWEIKRAGEKMRNGEERPLIVEICRSVGRVVLLVTLGREKFFWGEGMEDFRKVEARIGGGERE